MIAKVDKAENLYAKTLDEYWKTGDSMSHYFLKQI